LHVLAHPVGQPKVRAGTSGARRVGGVPREGVPWRGIPGEALEEGLGKPWGRCLGNPRGSP
jgi:hypothetical protein